MPKPFYKISKSQIDEIIRVNHAGEFGAQRIYLGQIKYSSDPRDRLKLESMLNQEQNHLNYFAKAIERHNVRPTALIPLWNAIGYSLGMISAKAGSRTAMMITEAIEDVIEKHYLKQIDFLDKAALDADLAQEESKIDKAEIVKTLEQFRQEEIEHKDIAIESESQLAPMSFILSKMIRRLCQISIALSKKV